MTGPGYLIGFISLFILGAAYQTQTGWLYLTGASGLGVVALAWALAWLGLRGVRAEALAVPPCHQGAQVPWPVLVHRDRPGAAPSLQVFLPNKPPGRLFGLSRGALMPEHWQAATVADVAPGRPGRANFQLPAARRGEFPFPALVVQSAYPLGLVALTRRLAPEGTYLIYPVGPRVGELPWLAPTGEAQGQQRLVDARQGQLIRGVREYRSGDAWREIHWRTTARLGHPHVRESEQDQGEALVLLLDLRASVHTEATLEHVITVAASLVAHGQEHGRPVQLLAQPEATPVGEAPAGFEAWAWLARARATAVEPPRGPSGAVLLSSAYVPGWQQWASHFVYCPPEAANAMDATVYCPVGAPIAECLGVERRA
jgi:uncharacterized protein (DUF58 family)